MPKKKRYLEKESADNTDKSKRGRANEGRGAVGSSVGRRACTGGSLGTGGTGGAGRAGSRASGGGTRAGGRSRSSRGAGAGAGAAGGSRGAAAAEEVLANALLGAVGVLLSLLGGAVALGACSDTSGGLVDLALVGVGDRNALGLAADVGGRAGLEAVGDGSLLGRGSGGSGAGGGGESGRLSRGQDGESAGDDDGGETHLEVLVGLLILHEYIKNGVSC